MLSVQIQTNQNIRTVKKQSIVLALSFCLLTLSVEARTFFVSEFPLLANRWRGGAVVKSSEEAEAFTLLARAVQSRIKAEDGSEPDTSKVVEAFQSLSAAQQAFKAMDGAAHEAYQRTHSDTVDISVSGRARRSAARAAAAADALGACELCELVEFPERFDFQSVNGTLVGREVLLNLTDAIKLDDSTNVSVLVLYESEYRGGVGVDHGGIEADSKGTPKGRLHVVIKDGASSELGATLQVLDHDPLHVRLHSGLVNSEAASVQPLLYKCACSVLRKIEHVIQLHNTSAIHFSGRSLGGGIAAIAAMILDGSLPFPKIKTKQAKRKSKIEVSANETNTTVSLSGIGKGRTSALTLGSPPCVSSNVKAEYVISIMYGDDIISRTSKESFENFLKRTTRALKRGGIIGRQLNWMTDTVSLATSNLMSHAHGSEGEEARLSVPGRAFLVRPRRLGGMCSMHEIGSQLKGGREALRAAVLWQLNEVLLSKSLWKHHQLESYIHGIDRIHLRSIHED